MLVTSMTRSLILGSHVHLCHFGYPVHSTKYRSFPQMSFVLCISLQPFAMKMAVVRIFVELGNG